MGAALSLRGLERRFGEAGLRGVDLEAKAGELLGVVGPSGSGKSTLLRLVAGLDRPDRGEILLDGVAVTRRPPVERSIGMTFDDGALYEHLDVRSNITIALDAARLGAREEAAAIDAAAELARCRPLLGRRAESLSSGERRRVALARAVVRRPALLLLDEPLGQLDRAARLDLRDDLRGLQRATGATTLLVTHDHEDAIAIADRIAYLAAGRILQIGSPLELWRSPAHLEVARGFGPLPMNIVARGDASLAFRGEDLEFAPPDALPPEGGWSTLATVPEAASGGLVPGAATTLIGAEGERIRCPAERLPPGLPPLGVIRLLVRSERLIAFAPDGRRSARP